MLRVMLSPKYFQFTSPRAHTLNQAIRFVWLTTRFAHFGYNNIRINSAINPPRPYGVAVLSDLALETNEHMLFCVIEPVTRSPRSYYALKLVMDVCIERDCVSPGDSYLIDFDPNDFVYPPITPCFQIFSSCFHGASGYPKKN